MISFCCFNVIFLRCVCVCVSCGLCVLFAVTRVSIVVELVSRKFCCFGSGLPDNVQYPLM